MIATVLSTVTTVGCLVHKAAGDAHHRRAAVRATSRSTRGCATTTPRSRPSSSTLSARTAARRRCALPDRWHGRCCPPGHLLSAAPLELMLWKRPSLWRACVHVDLERVSVRVCFPYVIWVLFNNAIFISMEAICLYTNY